MIKGLSSSTREKKPPHAVFAVCLRSICNKNTSWLFFADKEQAVSPEGDSTAPPSQASERSDLPHNSKPRGGPKQPQQQTANTTVTRPQQHQPPRTAAAGAPQSKPGVGPAGGGVVSQSEPRGRGGGTGVIIGDQPPLDVDALLRRGSVPTVEPDDEDDLEEEEKAAAAKAAAAAAASNTPLTDAEKMRKGICELVDTEQTYVRHLGYLMKTYLEPLKREAFLSNAEISSLFGNIQEIYKFQQQFLRALDEAIESEPQFNQLETPSQFKVIEKPLLFPSPYILAG